MNDTIQDAIDIVETIMWFVIGLMAIVFSGGIVLKNLQPYTLPDKTSITATTNNEPEHYQWYVRDYILMLMVADDYCPEPKMVDIKLGSSMQDTKLILDSEYVVNKAGRLQKYYINFLNSRVDKPITAYDYFFEGENGEDGRWRFYVDD